MSQLATIDQGQSRTIHTEGKTTDETRRPHNNQVCPGLRSGHPNHNTMRTDNICFYSPIISWKVQYLDVKMWCKKFSLRSYVSRRCGCNRPGIYCCFESFCGGWRREGEGSLHAQQFDDGWILTKQLLRDGWQVRLEQEYWMREFLKMAQCEDDIWVPFPVNHFVPIRREQQ